MRRQSLVEEFQGKDIRYVQSRINDVLRSLPQNDRNEVLASYSRDIVVQTAKEKDKQFFLAQLLDSLLDRKSVNQNSQQQPPQQQRPVTASAAASVATQQHILADSNNARHVRNFYLFISQPLEHIYLFIDKSSVRSSSSYTKPIAKSIGWVDFVTDFRSVG